MYVRLTVVKLLLVIKQTSVKKMRVTNILLTGASGLGALSQVPDHLNKRAACNRDNLFRCFIDQRYSSQANDFCAELAPFTATVATSVATV